MWGWVFVEQDDSRGRCCKQYGACFRPSQNRPGSKNLHCRNCSPRHSLCPTTGNAGKCWLSSRERIVHTSQWSAVCSCWCSGLRRGVHMTSCSSLGSCACWGVPCCAGLVLCASGSCSRLCFCFKAPSFPVATDFCIAGKSYFFYIIIYC